MPPETQVDFLAPQEGGGTIAYGNVAKTLLANGMNVSALRTNATLRKDEWNLLDTAVVTAARERLNAVADLIERGLTFNVPNAMGTTVVQHETQSELIAAEVSMDGVTRSQNDRLTFSLVSTPLPITHRDFILTARNLASSRKLGTPLDSSTAAEASRQVSEKLEDMMVNGLTTGDTLMVGSGSAQLFGYTNAPNRNTVNLATVWDTDSAASGLTILADVLSMIVAAQNDKMFGPYMLYIPTNFWVKLEDDFKTQSDKTIMDRVKQISGIIDVKPLDKLADDNVLLVQMTSNVVDLIVGEQTTTVEWPTEGGMVLNFKVMAIMVPRIKSDYVNNSGLVHLS